jgi:hypothetical protein
MVGDFGYNLFVIWWKNIEVYPRNSVWKIK